MFGLGSAMLVTLGVVWLGCAFYFLPGWIAHRRGHPDATAITVLNVFAGWSVVGWIVAIVWASTRVDASPTARPVFTMGSVTVILLVPVALVIGGLAMPKGQPAPAVEVSQGRTAQIERWAAVSEKRTAEIEMWAEESPAVADLTRRRVLSSAGAKHGRAFVVVGPRFARLSQSAEDSVIAGVGEDLTKRVRTKILVVYGEDGNELLGTWSTWRGFQR